MLKKILAALLLTLPAAPAAAWPTYWASSYNLAVPIGATDIVCLENPNGIVVRLLGVSLYGTGGAAGTIDITVVRRTPLNTGGTSTTPAVSGSDLNAPASQTVFRAYTVNPTALGTVTGTFRSLRWDVTTNGSNADPTGTTMLGFNSLKEDAVVPMLRARGSAFCVNFNAAAVASTVTIDMVWSESNN
jgi:hypothetical protein